MFQQKNLINRKKVTKTEVGKNRRHLPVAWVQPHAPAPGDLAVCSQVDADTAQLRNLGSGCWEESCVRKDCKKGDGCSPSLLESCFQTPALALGPCQGSFSMPGHVPHCSRAHLDPLTWLPSLDLHLSHHYRFVWEPLDCWLTLITTTRLALLFFFGYYGTGPLSVQS